MLPLTYEFFFFFLLSTGFPLDLVEVVVLVVVVALVKLDVLWKVLVVHYDHHPRASMGGYSFLRSFLFLDFRLNVF